MSAEDPIKKFVQLVLVQAAKNDATEVAIDAAQDKSTPIKYKVKGAWYNMAPPPAHLRAPIVRELALLADLPEGPFPKQGTIEAVADDVPSKWELSAPSDDGEWALTRSAK